MRTTLPEQTEIRQIIDTILEALDAAATLEAFLQRLEAAGVVVKANIAHTGKMNGFRFELDGASFTGAELGEPYKWPRLKERLSYTPERDNIHLFARRHGLATEMAVAVESDGDEPISALDEPESSAPVVSEFSFKTHPSQDFLRQALEDYASGSAKGRIYIDHAPTGTGKSWALTNEPVQHALQWAGKKTIIFLAPEKRHLQPIFEELKKRLDGSVQAVAIRARLDALWEYGIPAGCPLRAQTDDRDGAEAIRQIEKTIPLIERHWDLREQLKETLEIHRNRLARSCRQWIEAQAKTPTPQIAACEKCLCMFPGNYLFKARKVPMIAVMTYDRLFYGLSAFEIANGRARHFVYTPFVSSPSKREVPFKNCFIVGEEFSHGHRRIVGRIEETALYVSVFDAASFVVRGFSDAFQKVSMQIQSHDAALHQEKSSDLAAVEKYVLDRRSSYWLLSRDVFPFKNGRACLLLKPELATDVMSFVTSLNPAYSSLFSSAHIGARVDQAVSDSFDEDSYRLLVKRFETAGQMKLSGYGSLAVSANQAIARVLAPIARTAACFAGIAASVAAAQRDDWGGFFLYEASQRHDNIMQYINSLAWSKRQIGQPDSADEDAFDILDEFFLRGYELVEATQTDGRQIDVKVRLSQGSPEGMLHHLASAGNTLYLSSASVTIRSAVTNVDLDWLRRRHQVTTLPHEAGQQVLDEKTAAKRIPSLIWAKAGTKNVLGMTLENKGEPQKILDTLNTFALDLQESGASATRYALIFCNSAKECHAAITAFEAFLGHFVDPERVHCEYLDAAAFANHRFEEIKTDICQHLTGTAPPKLYLLFSTYNGLATGANLHVELDTIPGDDANFWSYTGHRGVRRHVMATGLSADISDIVLVEPISHITSEDNYYRIGHQLAAMGDLDWMMVGRKVFERQGAQEPWQLTSAAVKRTNHFISAQFDTAMQAIGRMDRTLNSADHPKIFLNTSFSGLFAAVTEDVIGETILPPTIEALISSARKQLRTAEVAEKNDFIRSLGLSSSEFFTHLAQEVRESAVARELWIGLRDFLFEHQVVHSKDWFAKSEEAKAIAPLLEKYGVSLSDFYFDLPAEALATKGNTLGVVCRRDDHHYVFFDPSNFPLDGSKVWYDKYARNARGTVVVRPALMHEVVRPFEYEKRCKWFVSDWAKKTVMDDRDIPGYLFERSDLFVEQCDAAIDAKAWSVHTMAASTSVARVEQLIADARKKLAFMQAEAPAGAWFPRRYIYAFRNWWPALTERYGRVAVFFDGGNQVADCGSPWDVAFVQVDEHRIIEGVLDVLDKYQPKDEPGSVSI